MATGILSLMSARFAELPTLALPWLPSTAALAVRPGREECPGLMVRRGRAGCLLLLCTSILWWGGAPQGNTAQVSASERSVPLLEGAWWQQSLSGDDRGVILFLRVHPREEDSLAMSEGGVAGPCGAESPLLAAVSGRLPAQARESRAIGGRFGL